jgi:hypothetical protein
MKFLDENGDEEDIDGSSFSFYWQKVWTNWFSYNPLFFIF